MRRGAAAVLCVLLAVGVWTAVGQLIDSRVAAVLVELEQTAAGGGSLIVHRFDYQRGWRAGELDYDLEWRPPLDSEWYLLVEGIRSVAADALRVQGKVDVRHGPWVGGEQPWALARTEAAVPLPDALVAALPDYPAGQPLLTLSGTLGFDGTLTGDLQAAAYDGVLRVGAEQADLTLTGLALTFAASGDLDAGRLALFLDRLQILPTNSELRLEGLDIQVATAGTASPTLELSVALRQFVASMETLRLELETGSLRSATTEAQPNLWTGEASGSVSRLRAGNGIFSAEFQGLQGATRAELTADGHYDTEVRGEITDLRLNDAELGSLEVAGGARHLDPQAYADLIGANPGTGDALQRLWAAQPTVAVDRLALTLPGAGALEARLAVTGRGRAAIDVSQPDSLLDDLLADGQLDLPRPVLRRLVEIGVGIINPGLQGVERELRVDDLLLAVSNTLAESPLVTVDANGVRSTLRIADGRVFVNGEDRLPVAELAAWFIDAPEPAITPAFLLPEFDGEPRVARLRLAAGFAPQPQVQPVLAGGRDDPQAMLGVDCPGQVRSPQPDVTLSYTASAGRALYLYAESDDDVTLLILGPDGWRCDDDSHGSFDPGVVIEAPLSGDYRIWVGTYQAGETEAILGVMEF